MISREGAGSVPKCERPHVPPECHFCHEEIRCISISEVKAVSTLDLGNSVVERGVPSETFAFTDTQTDHSSDYGLCCHNMKVFWQVLGERQRRNFDVVLWGETKTCQLYIRCLLKMHRLWSNNQYQYQYLNSFLLTYFSGMETEILIEKQTEGFQPFLAL